MGLSGNILVKSNIPKSKCDVFDPLISKYDWMGGSYLGLHHYIMLGPNTYFFEAGYGFLVLQITHNACFPSKTHGNHSK